MTKREYRRKQQKKWINGGKLESGSTLSISAEEGFIRFDQSEDDTPRRADRETARRIIIPNLRQAAYAKRTLEEVVDRLHHVIDDLSKIKMPNVTKVEFESFDEEWQPDDMYHVGLYDEDDREMVSTGSRLADGIKDNIDLSEKYSPASVFYIAFQAPCGACFVLTPDEADEVANIIEQLLKSKPKKSKKSKAVQ